MITALLQASYPPLMKSAYDSDVLSVALTSMTTANADLLASGTYYIAETDRGRLVGCGGWSRQVHGVGTVVDSIGHIRHFATHPNWIGQGVGSAIYTTRERQASRLGIIQFDCFSSLNAEGFYAALGFKRIRRVEVTMPKVTFPAVLMRRTI